MESANPLRGPFTGRKPHFLGILVLKETLSQGPVKPLHDALVPVDIDPATPHLDAVLREKLKNCTHKLTSRIDLE